MNTPTFTRVAVTDALPGDEVFQGGKWTPVAAFHIHGSRRDLVMIVWPSGGTLSIPISHCPTIRRAIPAAAPERCESLARKGTGTGICDAPLTHGNCPRAGNHADN